MLAMSGLSEIKSGRVLKKDEKRVTLIIKPDGVEYKYFGEWTGRDVRRAMKFLIRSYKLNRHKKAKMSILPQCKKKEKHNGD